MFGKIPVPTIELPDRRFQTFLDISLSEKRIISKEAYDYCQLTKPAAYSYDQSRLVENKMFKADMKSYKPLETAAIFFSSEPFLKQDVS